MASKTPPATPPVSPPPAGDAPKRGGVLRAIFKLVLLLLVLVGGIVGYAAATQPNDFRIGRSVTVAAAPDAVFPQINNLHNFHTWNPFAKSDPNGKFTFEGPEEGVGAKQAWSGNSELGEGTMTIVESKPNELVKMDLVFVRPMAADNDATFVLKPEGDKTTVTWEIFGPMTLPSKVMCLFMNMDQMVGGSFESGLADLKTRVESPVK